MSQINYVQLHIGDFLGGTIGMDAAETGAYIMLILAHYQAGEKGLPDDDAYLARVAKVGGKMWKKIRPRLEGKFSIENGYWTSARVVQELLRVNEVSSQRKASALKRHGTSDANAQQMQCEPITSNQEPKDAAVVTRAPRSVSHETKPERKTDTVSVGKTIAAITGWDADPNWFGDYARIEVWLNAGWDPDLDIIPTVRRLMVGRSAPPRSLKYFEGAIADACAARTSPIPKGSPNATHHPKPTQHDRLEAAGREALDDIFAEIDSRYGAGESGGAGQPDPAELRNIPRLRQAAGSGEKHHPWVHDGHGALHDRGNPGRLPDLVADAIEDADPSADFGAYPGGPDPAAGHGAVRRSG